MIAKVLERHPSSLTPSIEIIDNRRWRLIESSIAKE
jgi:hypothetical protein